MFGDSVHVLAVAREGEAMARAACVSGKLYLKRSAGLRGVPGTALSPATAGTCGAKISATGIGAGAEDFVSMSAKITLKFQDRRLKVGDGAGVSEDPQAEALRWHVVVSWAPKRVRRHQAGVVSSRSSASGRSRLG